MKHIFLMLLLCGGIAMQAQQNAKNPAPSDAAVGYVYHYDNVRALILSRIENPSPANLIAQPILDAKDFPEYRKAILADRKAFIMSLQQWMSANAGLIIETFKSDGNLVIPYSK